MKKISKKKEVKEPNYLLFYLVSVLIALVAHYFLFSKTNLHPTLQVFISFLIFSASMGIITLIGEKK